VHPLIRSVRYRLAEWSLLQRELRTPFVRECLQSAAEIGLRNVRFVARGGTALVFRGSGVWPGELAIKLPRCEEAEFSLRREGDALALVDLASVPRLMWRPPNGRFFIREFVEGESVAYLVKRGRTSSLLPALFETARSLFPLVHDSSFGHFVLRDFKPRNLILHQASARVKLIDLGAVRREGTDAATRDAVARLGSGKWRYWAPEQLVGAPSIDRRADYFSLGATAFYVATGRAPYANMTTGPDAALRVYDDAYPQVVGELRQAGVSSRFLAACLHPSPDQRPSSMEGFDV